MNSKENNYIYSPYPDMELPHPSISVTEMLWKRIENWLDATALVCGITGEIYTYRQMKELSCNFASSLLRSGVRPGDLIGFVSPLNPAAVIALLGILQAGCVFTPLNHLYTQYELLREITKLGFKCMVSSTDIFQVLQSVREDIPHLKNFILLDSSMKADSIGNEICFFEDMIKVSTSREDEIFSNRLNNDENSLAAISSSSGSTGLPKSVMLTHYALCFATKYLHSNGISNTKSFKNGNPQEVTISMYPLSHVFGYHICLLVLMYQGMKIIVVDKFQPTLFTELLRKYRPTYLPIVAPIVKFIAESPMISSKELESVKTILASTTSVTKCLIDTLIKKAEKNICFLEMYGATECLYMTSNNSSFKNSKIGSVGKLYPNFVAKIVDVETGKCLGPNENGEIRIKCPTFMNGYFNDEKATKEVFDEDGFYCTGDIAYYDEDGCFYIADRIKDMIKVKAFQVLPKEIELVIRTNSKVNDVAVIGVPHERWGEAPRAYIVKNDETLQAEEIHLLVKEKLAPFKQLEGGIEFIKKIPKIGVGKPGKHLLRELYRKNINK